MVRYRDPTVADSPVLDFDFTASPANVRSGTKVRVTSRFVGLSPTTPDKRKTAPACHDRVTARLTGEVDYDVFSSTRMRAQGVYPPPSRSSWP
ncbi:hypothetical protein GCM10027176_60310 [Actinoallomurus bryophytorum]